MASFPMHYAAEDGDLERVRQLIAWGESVDSRDFDGRTPLQWAAQQGRYEVAKLLIDSGCDLNPKDFDGQAPLWLAARVGTKDVVNLLIERGAQVNCADGYKWTPLHFASHEDWLDVVLHILEKREADPNAAAVSGITPLMKAVGRDVAAVLIRAGADVNRKSHELYDWTALHFAAVNGHPGLVQALLEKEGLNLNPRDILGRTPLHYACDSQHQDIVKQLLEAGADHNIRNNIRRETALGVHIRENAKPEIIRLLLQHGAFFEDSDFVHLFQNPVISEDVLKELCSQSIINKFNNQSLTTLYRNPYLARKLPDIIHFKLNARQIEEVENLVKREIDKPNLCNIVKVRPMSLSALCVRSLAAFPQVRHERYSSRFR